MKKAAALSLCLVLLLSNLISGASAASFRDEASASAERLINAELTLNGVGSVQDFSRFCASVPESAYGQFLFPLALNGYTGGQNVDELCDLIVNNTGAAASTKQKYALMLLACGCENEYCDTVIDETAGRQGIMSCVFALHLLNNGRKSGAYTALQLAEYISSLALENGGWALMGENADTDVTAMVIQAVSGYYDNENVKSGIDKALDILSRRQGESGAFTGFGGENAETTAQVIIALNSLGADFIADSRFTKNGNTALDGLKRFELADGTFSHTEGGEYDAGSTAQAYSAFVSFECGNIYKFVNTDLKYTDLAANSAEPADESAKTPVKYILASAAMIIAVIVSIILFAVKKRNIKNFIFVWLVAAAAVACIFVFNVQSADEFYNSPVTQKGDISGTVTLEIRCDTVAGEIGSDGVVLKKCGLPVGDGETVYDVICTASREYGIKLITSGFGTSVYVSGIENLCEFDYGDLSGWIYTVNGAACSEGCGNYKVEDGDEIAFLYSLDLGEDVGVNTP